jgi:hypothetical protein
MRTLFPPLKLFLASLNMLQFLAAILFLMQFIACRDPKIIEVKLPKHEPLLIVESYLEPGFPKTVIVQQSSGYFDAPDVLIIPDAFVTISDGTRTDTLVYTPLSVGVFSFGVYTSLDTASIVKPEYGKEFTLRVEAKLKNGETRIATARTRLLEPVPVLRTLHVFDGKPENRAYITGYLKDAPGEVNFYRVIFLTPSTSIYPMPNNSNERDSVIEYTVTDDLFNGQEIPFGSPPFFEPGEEVRIKLINISKEYYDYLVSLESAVEGNGSPFVEPFNVRGNIQGEGVRGIFTGLSYQLFRDTIPNQ